MNENEYKKEMTAVGKEFARLFAEYGGRMVLQQATVSAVYLEDAESPNEPFTMDARMTNGAEVLGIVLGIVGGGNMGVLFIPQVGARVVLAVPDGEASSVFPLCYDKIEKTVIRYNWDDETDLITASSEGISVNRGDYSCNITKENISLSCKDGASLNLADDTITMNGGELKGLVKLEELESNLNSLKDYCETLKDAIVAGFGKIGSGMSANGGSGATEFEGKMAGASISFKDMENKNIIQ